MKVKEALSRWGQTLPPHGTKGSVEARKPLVNHLEVSDTAVAAWLKSGRFPNGEILIRLYFFLESYFEIKIEDAPVVRDPIRVLGKTVGSKAIKVKELTEKLGFGNNTDSVLKIIRGSTGTTDQKIGIIVEINKEYAPQVEMTRLGIHALSGHQPTQVMEPSTPSIEEHPILIPQLSAAEEALLLVSRFSILPTMDAMEQLVFSDNEKLREEFRSRNEKLWGRFSKLASALTSEMARRARIADGLSITGGCK